METIMLDKDTSVFYITAKSFPAGILDAHNRLRALVPFSNDRRYFGISRPENNGEIIYRAAAEEIDKGEAEKYGCGTMIIKKGKYLSVTVKDFMKDPRSIERAFKKLLANPGIDPQGYCVEAYLNEGDIVKCMVRLEDFN